MDYNKLKVAELRDVLKQRGIPSTGLSRKQQIVDALEAHDATQTNGEPGKATSAAGPSVDDGNTPGIEKSAILEDGAEDAQTNLEPTSGGLESADRNGVVASNEDSTMVEAATLHESKDTVEEVAESGDLPAQGDPDAAVADSESTKVDVTLADSREQTPRQALSSLEEQSSETRKRKRRSPTPTPSEASINKKLKTAEDELVKLPEDNAVDDVAVVLDTSSVAADHKETLPNSTSDDVMEADTVATSSEPTTQHAEFLPKSLNGQTTQQTLEQYSGRPLSPADMESSAPESIHPTTRSLYIRDLLRPLQPQQLRAHIVSLATQAGVEPDDSVVTMFHLDNIRTHAFVTFTSTAAATRVRAALHGQVWPDESTRKKLWIDFVPDERVQEWIDRELDSGANKRDVRRWEIEYTTLNDGTVTASLQEITAPTGPRRKSSFSNQSLAAPQGQGMMNAPLGPRADRPSLSSTQAQPSEPRRNRTPTPTTSNNQSTASFNVLDQRFSSTITKPKIYYLPVSASLAEKRLETLDRETSRTWDRGRAMKGASGVEQQLRRYTFEDGERLVDGGVDGGYGYRGPGGGFGGRRGGGGYRGSRGRGF